MALMFTRVARNFAKNGYFPTDEDTLAGVLSLLAPARGRLRVLDPCCGEGVALAECRARLDGAEAFGVELDEERAWHAKTLLERVIHGDLFDCTLGPRQFSLLWLNPPYGDLPDGQSVKWKGRKRLEKLFYERTVGSLQWGGVMVLIVPHYAVDPEFAGWIARHFDAVRVYRAATDRFKQIVVLGVRRRAVSASATVRDLLTAAGDDPGGAPRVVASPDPVYTVPAAPQGEVRFETCRMDPRQLAHALGRSPGLWGEARMLFGRGQDLERRPLQAPSDWHLALGLAAGQIHGVVTSNDGAMRWAVKGDTHKEKDVQVHHEPVGRDPTQTREVRVATDRFVPVIRAIDLTPGPSLGRILTIR